jgi:SAM-dependent methyltransferase
MSALTRWFDSKLYRSFESNWDDKLLRSAILSRLKPEFHVLDLGAGAGIVADMNFRNLVARMYGVDPDPRVEANPYLDEGRVGTGEHLPYGNEMFDVVFADNVVEHLADPAAVFTEVARVLKGGGLFVFKTPNRRHYMASIARLTPHRFHQAYNKMRGRAAGDTFPTRYLANTRPDVERVAKESGLVVESIEFIEGRPEYLRPFAFTYILGWGYERMVNISSLFEPFRIILIASLRKPLRELK